jgi:hypothetical protein
MVKRQPHQLCACKLRLHSTAQALCCHTSNGGRAARNVCKGSCALRRQQHHMAKTQVRMPSAQQHARMQTPHQHTARCLQARLLPACRVAFFCGTQSQAKKRHSRPAAPCVTQQQARNRPPSTNNVASLARKESTCLAPSPSACCHSGTCVHAMGKCTSPSRGHTSAPPGAYACQLGSHSTAQASGCRTSKHQQWQGYQASMQVQHLAIAPLCS